MDRERVPSKGDTAHLHTQRQDGILHRFSCLLPRDVATCKHSLVTHSSALGLDTSETAFPLSPIKPFGQRCQGITARTSLL